MSAQFPFDTHFARDGGYLISEDSQRLDHAVDRVSKFGDFAFRFDQQFAFQVAIRDSGHNLRDSAHLVGQITGHEIHVVSEILPRSRNAFDFGLTTEFSFGANFASNTSYFRSKR